MICIYGIRGQLSKVGGGGWGVWGCLGIFWNYIGVMVVFLIKICFPHLY